MIHVVAVITAKPGQRAAILEHFRANVPAVRAEEGCIEYGAAVDADPALPFQKKWGDDTFLVLQSTGIHSTTALRIVMTRDLAVRDSITLKGAFGYDALSPDGTKLYLIQHSSAEDLEHYVVRAYDLTAHRLLRGRIADKTQQSWVMQGFPLTRTTSVDGRWVFTLYQNPGGYPFVHALDTVRSVAHCVGLPWTAKDQGPLNRLAMTLHGKTLAVQWQSGKRWLNIDTGTWKLHVLPA